MSNERRRHTRLALRTPEMDGFFRIHFNEEWYPLTDIHDVSISGMGFRFATPINPGTVLRISYMSRDFETTLPATVKWCRDKAQDGNPAVGYTLALEFDMKNVNENMLMFMALRKFLDPFT